MTVIFKFHLKCINLQCWSLHYLAGPQICYQQGKPFLVLAKWVLWELWVLLFGFSQHNLTRTWQKAMVYIGCQNSTAFTMSWFYTVQCVTCQSVVVIHVVWHVRFSGKTFLNNLIKLHAIADVAISKRLLLFTVWMQLCLRSHQNFYKIFTRKQFCQLLWVTRKRRCTFGMINRGHLELATSPTGPIIQLLLKVFWQYLSHLMW